MKAVMMMTMMMMTMMMMTMMMVMMTMVMMLMSTMHSPHTTPCSSATANINGPAIARLAARCCVISSACSEPQSRTPNLKPQPPTPNPSAVGTQCQLLMRTRSSRRSTKCAPS